MRLKHARLPFGPQKRNDLERAVHYLAARNDDNYDLLGKIKSIFYFILFYFILFYFILFYFILFYFNLI